MVDTTFEISQRLLDCIKPLDDFQEQEPEWTIEGWMPKGQITLLASDGGVGKTTAWVHIAAALSAGRPCFLDSPGNVRKPQKVLFLTTEDSVSKKLKRQLREAGAKMPNIFAPDYANGDQGQLDKLKFCTVELQGLIEYYTPALVVFDPLQGFIPPDVNMGARNAMRSCMAPLVGLGEKTGTSFLIVCHTNKRKGASGRDRLADSADIWDIARSVIMMGYTGEDGIRYCSHEKCNYGELKKTVLFSTRGGRLELRGETWRRDQDYQSERALNLGAPKKEDCKAFILQTLEQNGGSIATKKLDEVAKAACYSSATLRNAKDSLKAEQKIRYKQSGNGKVKEWAVHLMPEPMNI